jgi:AbrB family looped-hinge helix DNA binding protein
MKVTTKGQVTIPQDIREEAGIVPGDDVEFVLKDGTICLVHRKQAKTRGQRIVEHLRGRATLGMTTDEIMALTRGDD